MNSRGKSSGGQNWRGTQSTGRGPFFGPKTCKLPSDGLTKKQLQELNGKVETYQMKTPTKYETFMKWPEDLQRQFIKNILDKYGKPNYVIQKCLGVCEVTAAKTRKRLGIPPAPPGCRLGSKKKLEILRALEGPQTPVKDAKEEPKQETEKTAWGTASVPPSAKQEEAPAATPTMPQPLRSDSLQLRMTGTLTLADLFAKLASCPIPKGEVTVTILIERTKGEKQC